MTMLSVVQRFCERTNVDVPSTVMGTTDPQVRQIKAMLEEEGNNLATRGDWQELTIEATHTTVATESQGDIKTIADRGFAYIKGNTIWDRDLRLPVYVISDQDWQQVKATAVTGPRYQARIRGGELLCNPVPTAGHTWAFEYISNKWIEEADGTSWKRYFTLDTDVLLLSEELLLSGLRWRWKKEKGLEYAEDFATYEREAKDALSRSGMKPVLDMSNRTYTPSPKIYTPEGNWNL